MNATAIAKATYHLSLSRSDQWHCLECGQYNHFSAQIVHAETCGHRPGNDYTDPLELTRQQYVAMSQMARRHEIEPSSLRLSMATLLDGLPDGYVVGWVNSIYVGCSPEGVISS
jgi:hypothetical protein